MRPELVPLIHRVVWMGGARGRGNHTEAAEFNAFADPEALATLLSRGGELTVIDLAPCREVQIGEADVAAVREGTSPRAELLADLLGGYLDIGLSRGRAGMALYDPVAAAALIAPDLFDFEETQLRVVLEQGAARGRTAMGPDAPEGSRVRRVRAVDAEGVRRLLAQALEAHGANRMTEAPGHWDGM